MDTGIVPSSGPGLPGEVEEFSTDILNIIPKGNTVIHRYPSQQARAGIWRALMEWALTRKDKRQDLSGLVSLLNVEYPGLDLKLGQANYAIEAFVCPAMVRLIPDAVKRGLVQAGVDLDTTTAKLQRAQKIMEQILEMEKVDPALRDVLDGRYEKWSENYSKLNKSWLALVESGESGLERFNIIPAITKKVDIKKDERRIDLKGTLERVGLGDAFDVPFKAHGDGSPPASAGPPG